LEGKVTALSHYQQQNFYTKILEPSKMLLEVQRFFVYFNPGATTRNCDAAQYETAESEGRLYMNPFIFLSLMMAS
jgi:hypothetical protein